MWRILQGHLRGRWPHRFSLHPPIPCPPGQLISNSPCLLPPARPGTLFPISEICSLTLTLLASDPPFLSCSSSSLAVWRPNSSCWDLIASVGLPALPGPTIISPQPPWTLLAEALSSPAGPHSPDIILHPPHCPQDWISSIIPCQGCLLKFLFIFYYLYF